MFIKNALNYLVSLKKALQSNMTFVIHQTLLGKPSMRIESMDKSGNSLRLRIHNTQKVSMFISAKVVTKMNPKKSFVTFVACLTAQWPKSNLKMKKKRQGNTALLYISELISL